jgi:hypothetical protein
LLKLPSSLCQASPDKLARQAVHGESNMKGLCITSCTGGNERRNIVSDDRDRDMFLDTLAEMSQRFEVDIFAYVLMDNHLLFRSNRANLSQSMQWFGATFTKLVDKNKERFLPETSHGEIPEQVQINKSIDPDAVLLQVT